jgi:hypothetical protein
MRSPDCKAGALPCLRVALLCRSRSKAWRIGWGRREARLRHVQAKVGGGPGQGLSLPYSSRILAWIFCLVSLLSG